jgi:hypothetical protein
MVEGFIYLENLAGAQVLGLAPEHVDHFRVGKPLPGAGYKGGVRNPGDQR